MIILKIFIAGPRAIKELDKNIFVKLENICVKNYDVLVGDADGIDSSIQKFLQLKSYKNVTVFASKGIARNNYGNWKIEKVEVANNVTGFEFYAQKDLEMAEKAKQEAEKAKIEFVDAIKNQISIYKFREEWDKAKSMFKELADKLGDVDTLTEYEDFCIERRFPDEAKAYYLKALDKLRLEGNNKDNKNKETELTKKLEVIK